MLRSRQVRGDRHWAVERLANDGLVHGVGGRERVVHGVPVSDVVLGVEANQPEGGREGDRPGQLLGIRTSSCGLDQGFDDLAWIVS